jgi:hypothetical protein
MAQKKSRQTFEKLKREQAVREKRMKKAERKALRRSGELVDTVDGVDGVDGIEGVNGDEAVQPDSPELAAGEQTHPDPV